MSWVNHPIYYIHNIVFRGGAQNKYFLADAIKRRFFFFLVEIAANPLSYVNEYHFICNAISMYKQYPSIIYWHNTHTCGRVYHF